VLLQFFHLDSTTFSLLLLPTSDFGARGMHRLREVFSTKYLLLRDRSPEKRGKSLGQFKIRISVCTIFGRIFTIIFL